MNYVQLSEQIQAFAENTFPETRTWDTRVVTPKQQIDQFIKNAEQRIYNTIQFPSLRKNVTGLASNGNKYLSTPNDFLSVYSLAVILPSGQYEYLLNKDVNFIRQAFPSPNSTGVPRYYALFGPTTTSDIPPVITNELSLILGPTPNSNYGVELHYFYYPVSITETIDGRTWLGDNFDTVLLYGALVEAAVFMKSEQDTLALYQGKYVEALTQAKRLGDGLERGDAYRDGQYKQPVT
jgi:hypothetical protein